MHKAPYRKLRSFTCTGVVLWRIFVLLYSAACNAKPLATKPSPPYYTYSLNTDSGANYSLQEPILHTNKTDGGLIGGATYRVLLAQRVSSSWVGRLAAVWSNLIDQYKKDLNEFVSTVKDDTSQVLSRATARMNDDVGALRRPRPDVKPRSNDQIEATLTKVINDPSVLVSFSDSDEEMYEDFSQFFKLSEQSDAIASILNESEEMKKIYGDLCPSKLTHNDFWCRYFYLKGQEVLARHRVGELEEDEEDLTWEGDEDEDEDGGNGATIDVGKDADTGEGREGVAGEGTAENNVEELLEEMEALKIELKRCKVDLASVQAENSRLKNAASGESSRQTASEETGGPSAEVAELMNELQTLRAENEDLRKVVSMLHEDEETEEGAKPRKESDGKQDDVEVVKSQKESEDWEGEGWSEWE